MPSLFLRWSLLRFAPVPRELVSEHRDQVIREQRNFAVPGLTVKTEQRTIKEKVGGTIDEVEKEKDENRIVYDVEAERNGNKIAFTVTEDGKILKTE